MTAHRWLVRTLIGFAAVIGVVAIFAVWANRQLLDTGYWTSTSTEMLESPPIRDALAGYMTEQLYANVDVAGELRDGLPSELKPLASPAAGALRDLVEKGIALALGHPRVQALWRTANEVAHKQFVRLIEDRGTVVRTRGNGTVVLDLRPMLGSLAQRVGAPTSVAEKIPPDVAELKLVRSNTLTTMQDAVNGLRSLALILPLLAFALLALAVYLARGRRRQTLIAVGVTLIADGLFVLIVRALIGHRVVDALVTTASVKPAGEAAWTIGTSVLADVAGATIFIGVPLILAGLLAGPTRVATALRHTIAPYLRDRPDIAFGAVALLLLLLFAWGPIDATRSLIGIAAITVLAFFGMQMLRRETAREFPDARLASAHAAHATSVPRASESARASEPEHTSESARAPEPPPASEPEHTSESTRSSEPTRPASSPEPPNRKEQR